jgi:acyl-CoA synthetase (AMP-forming)/AMP-acid ligase II
VNTVGFLSIPASLFPDQEILVFGRRRYTYAQLAELSARICTVFADLGLDRNPHDEGGADVVAVLDTNSDLYLAAYYAAARAGLTFLPLNYRAKPPELEYMLSSARARALLVGERYRSTVAQLRDRIPSLKTVIDLSEESQANLRRMAEAAAPAQAEAEVAEDDTSILMYTSGTTSQPKGVMLSFHDFTAYVTANVEMADGGDRGVALICVPFYHIAGATAMMSSPWSGRKMIVMPQFEPRAWLELVARERVTHAFVVPTMLKQLLDEPTLARTDLSSLRNLAYGGAPMPLAVVRRAIEALPPTIGFVNAYGQTETTSSLTILGPEDHRLEGNPEEIELKLKRLGSIGRPLADVEVMVRDESGGRLGPDQVGELCIRTPRVMKGYAGYRDELALGDGWRATGDLGWIDHGGYVFFAGRKDDLIIRGGENIAPAEVEAVLMSHPAVEEAAVVGWASQEWGQTVAAFVVARAGQKVDSAELHAFCAARLASFKCPKDYCFIDALPRNPLGKILRKELRAVD